MSRALFWTTALATLLSCVSASSADRGRLATGVWGGPHIRLDVAEDGTAALEFDCAHGTITEPIVPDGQGAFRTAGTFTREHAGPVREGRENAGRPAVYAGKVEGGTMTLTITLTGSGEDLGTFELVRGKTPRLTKCL